MGQYSKKGLYAGYDKNNKEREALDYYATPPEEVTNILNVMGIEFDPCDLILDPACGGGHMIKGIAEYGNNPKILGTDIMNRSNELTKKLEEDENIFIHYGKEYDFLSDNYLDNNRCDYVIMNPPFSVIIPFVQHALDIANCGVLMLGRLQFLEGKERYEKILKDNPPSKIWVYTDRIACYKNGDFSIKPSSIQAYAWFYWNKLDESKETKLYNIRRIGM